MIVAPRSARPHRVGLELLLRRDMLGLLTDLARQHGDIVPLALGRRRIYLVSHPELVREVLVNQQRMFVKGQALQRARSVLGDGLLTSEGEHHLRQRRLMQPAFHHERIEAYAATMSAYAARSTAGWQDSATINVAAEMARLTLAIVGTTLFAADVEGDAQAVGAALDELMARFSLLMLPFGALLERLPIAPARRLQQARARLDGVIARLIAEHRVTGDQGDLLSMLLLAQNTGGADAGMSDRQVRDEAMTLFLAGHETTANALSWTWHLLAQNPAAEARLHAEVDTVVGDRLPIAADLAALHYTRAVFAEALRLYPPAWAIGRRAIAPIALGGVSIPAGATVVISPWVIHRDPRFFPDPERFVPERWLPGALPEPPRNAYLPFGAGSRMCIGERFAWMEGTLVIATIAHRWRLGLHPGRVVTPQPAVTLRPRGGLPMGLTRRDGTPTGEGALLPTTGGCARGTSSLC